MTVGDDFLCADPVQALAMMLIHLGQVSWVLFGYYSNIVCICVIQLKCYSQHSAAVVASWWFFGCEHCNLNGQNYGSGVSVASNTGIYWDDFGSGSISLKSAQMAIRPMN